MHKIIDAAEPTEQFTQADKESLNERWEVQKAVLLDQQNLLADI